MASRDQAIKDFQQRLVLLQHVSICPFTNNCIPQKCRSFRNCGEMKALLTHAEKCEEEKCSVAHCVTTRFLLSHSKKCVDDGCVICRPLKESIKRKKQRGHDVVLKLPETLKSYSEDSCMDSPRSMVGELDFSKLTVHDRIHQSPSTDRSNHSGRQSTPDRSNYSTALDQSTHSVYSIAEERNDCFDRSTHSIAMDTSHHSLDTSTHTTASIHFIHTYFVAPPSQAPLSMPSPEYGHYLSIQPVVIPNEGNNNPHPPTYPPTYPPPYPYTLPTSLPPYTDIGYNNNTHNHITHTQYIQQPTTHMRQPAAAYYTNTANNHHNHNNIYDKEGVTEEDDDPDMSSCLSDEDMEEVLNLALHTLRQQEEISDNDDNDNNDDDVLDATNHGTLSTSFLCEETAGTSSSSSSAICFADTNIIQYHCSDCHTMIAEGGYRYYCQECNRDFCFDCFHDDSRPIHEHPIRAIRMKRVMNY